MRNLVRWGVLTVALVAGMPVQAQLSGPVRNGDAPIIVTGTRAGDAPKRELSDWRMAETPHVVVFSRGDEDELAATAESLEKLHFLLSVVTGRAGEPDETIKVAVTMIGDAGDFEQLRLTDLRWQYGPFPQAFENTIYFDPRAEGSVIATTKTDVNLILRHSQGRPTRRDCETRFNDLMGGIVLTPKGEFGEVDVDQWLSQMPVNELAFCQSAQSRLYSAFAQNFLMTYYPAAYPRWFLQGFGEMFATMVTGEGYVEYGHVPSGYFETMEHFGDYPVSRVLDGRYLSGQGKSWTPYHAWRMVHLLYFSEEWKPRLRAYLDAVAQGQETADAAALLGDPDELQNAVYFYRARKMEYERLDFPQALVTIPSVRRLTRAEAGIVRGRLELGARIEVPDEGARGRDAALARRESWLESLRENAERYPALQENHLLLAEAECKAGNPQRCLVSAEAVLERNANDTRALVWKGTALAGLAATSPAMERDGRLREARRFIARANRTAPDDILPLIAFYDSFAGSGEPATDVAVGGLYMVVEAAPAAPAPRLALGRELITRDFEEEARERLLPVAKGAFETPEKEPAADLLDAAN